MASSIDSSTVTFSDADLLDILMENEAEVVDEEEEIEMAETFAVSKEKSCNKRRTNF